MFVFTLRIACVSAPSVYQKLKQGVVDSSDRVSAVVFEYDRRFAAYGDDFIFYDYNEPLSFPASVAPQSFDIVLADPPYLSEECLRKVAKTIKHLSKGKVLLCTEMKKVWRVEEGEGNRERERKKQLKRVAKPEWRRGEEVECHEV
ncbi:protein-lysine N-methyltransferase N6AMT2 [Lates japonicus]|uniref:Protein-lysine N-methyltransferase N6AMT2 n=1 Tax=Lates japonicus TaxID=270547 RepID=A0AAD3NN99_LATJO|nr:protein-lysine N-methyltransferase N6AMT2 [Lates japonicus]